MLIKPDCASASATGTAAAEAKDAILARKRALKKNTGAISGSAFPFSLFEKKKGVYYEKLKFESPSVRWLLSRYNEKREARQGTMQMQKRAFVSVVSFFVSLKPL